MKEIKAQELNENPFKLIGDDWMLITAEKDGKVNTMTASWGGLGVIWGRTSATVYIRLSRYTKEFVDSSDHFSICVMPSSYKKDLAYCGKVSGRDEDKIAKCGFTVEHENGVPYFKESRLVMTCRKMFTQELSAAGFVDKSIIDANYSDKDWHVMYIGEIEKVLVD
ncbi:MAG: flavin reductase family protein [Treponema sp.]|nr:flavin reductase family protein [Treponema sp.]